MNDKDELKRCPFCGGNAILKRVSITVSCSSNVYDTWRVECSNCGATPMRNGYDSIVTRDRDDRLVIERDGRVAAIECWNNRIKD